MVFFSYRTKRDSPAGDQFWKFSRQCSIFGRIGDQWVAISSPGRQEKVKAAGENLVKKSRRERDEPLGTESYQASYRCT